MDLWKGRRQSECEEITVDAMHNCENITTSALHESEPLRVIDGRHETAPQFFYVAVLWEQEVVETSVCCIHICILVMHTP